MLLAFALRTVSVFSVAFNCCFSGDDPLVRVQLGRSRTIQARFHSGAPSIPWYPKCGRMVLGMFVGDVGPSCSQESRLVRMVLPFPDGDLWFSAFDVSHSWWFVHACVCCVRADLRIVSLLPPSKWGWGQAQCIPENDVSLKGPTEECRRCAWCIILTEYGPRKCLRKVCPLRGCSTWFDFLCAGLFCCFDHAPGEVGH